MLITLLVLLPKNLNTTAAIHRIVAALAALKYKMGNLEVLLMVEGVELDQVVNNVPLVRLVSTDNLIERGFKRALGEVVVVCDERFKLLPDDLTAISELFLNTENLGMVVWGSVWAVSKSADFSLPADVSCVKTYMIMSMRQQGKRVLPARPLVGLSRREILRFAYKSEKFSGKAGILLEYVLGSV